MTRTAADATWTKSVWDGQQLASELDSDGTRYTYVWGPERTPLALEVTRPGQAAVTYAYHTDALGSVVAITSPSGAVVASYAYDPYGALTQVGGSDAALAERNPLRYRAYYHDTTTGHYYLPARYYDPDTMRFLSPDPAPPSAGDPLSLNRYAYCVGDPVDMSDPTGEIADWDGDGRVSAYDVSQHAATHASNSKLKRLYTARAARQYYQSLLSSGRLGASRAAAVASMMVSYALDEAAAWADKEGIGDFYVDASAGYNGLGWNGMVGVMGGHVRNFRDGVMTDEHSYGGVAIGMPGPSYSIMVGEGAVAPGCRYIEFAAGAVGAGAFGFRSDNDRSAPWDFDAMGSHIAANHYYQGGLCQSEPSAGVSWFYVW